MSASRLSKSIQNAKVALIFYFLNLVLQFFSRKIFLDYLGSEVLGLNTTAQNLLGFLNLAELGIGSAVAYNLYKPIYENNKQAINDIVSIQGWLYRRVACVVIAGSCILMCFFPWIFAKAHVPLWYTYATFIALLIGALLSYFVNYKLIVLSADQKEYKITYCTQGVKIAKVLLQMVAIMTFAQWLCLLDCVGGDNGSRIFSDSEQDVEKGVSLAVSCCGERENIAERVSWNPSKDKTGVFPSNRWLCIVSDQPFGYLCLCLVDLSNHLW